MARRRAIAVVLLVGAAALGVAHAAPDAGPVSSAGDAGIPTAVLDAGPSQRAQPVSDPPPAAMEGDARLVAVLSNKGGAPTLVGKSGEMYEPTADMQWRRSGAGGVSTDVRALYRAGGGLFAVGSRAPLFRKRAGLWSAFHLGNRGRSAVSPTRMPMISVGRHIYELTGKSWTRVASAKGAVRALYASRAKQVYLVTTKDQLYVGYKSWRLLPIKLPKGDKIRSIFGLPGKHTLALSAQNRLYLLQAKGARLLPLGPKFRGLRIHATGIIAGKLMLAGHIGSGPKRKSILAEIGTQKLTAVSDLWPLEPGDRFALLYEDKDKRLMVASRQGQIRVQGKDGLWTNGALDVSPPAPPGDFSQSGPARSR